MILIQYSDLHATLALFTLKISYVTRKSCHQLQFFAIRYPSKINIIIPSQISSSLPEMITYTH